MLNFIHFATLSFELTSIVRPRWYVLSTWSRCGLEITPSLDDSLLSSRPTPTSVFLTRPLTQLLSIPTESSHVDKINRIEIGSCLMSTLQCIECQCVSLLICRWLLAEVSLNANLLHWVTTFAPRDREAISILSSYEKQISINATLSYIMHLKDFCR